MSPLRPWSWNTWGLNHLSWVRRIFVSGQDRTQELLEKTAAKPANIPALKLHPEFQRALNMWTNSYLNYFYLHDEMLEHLLSQPKTRGEVVAELEAKLLEQYQDPNLCTKPKELEKRGGAHYSSAAVSLIRDIHLGTGEETHRQCAEQRSAAGSTPRCGGGGALPGGCPWC